MWSDAIRTTVVIPKIIDNINKINNFGLGLAPEFLESIEEITRHYVENKVITDVMIMKLVGEIEYFNMEITGVD